MNSRNAHNIKHDSNIHDNFNLKFKDKTTKDSHDCGNETLAEHFTHKIAENIKDRN